MCALAYSISSAITSVYRAVTKPASRRLQTRSSCSSCRRRLTDEININIRSTVSRYISYTTIIRRARVFLMRNAPSVVLTRIMTTMSVRSVRGVEWTGQWSVGNAARSLQDHTYWTRGGPGLLGERVVNASPTKQSADRPGTATTVAISIATVVVQLTGVRLLRVYIRSSRIGPVSK